MNFSILPSETEEPEPVTEREPREAPPREPRSLRVKSHLRAGDAYMVHPHGENNRSNG